MSLLRSPFEASTTPPAYRDLSGAWYAVMGIDRDAPPEYRTPSAFAQAPADEAWVYSCVNRIASSGQGVPLRVYVKHGKDLVPAADEPSPEGDDLQYLLDYVNPVDMTGSDLKAYTLAAYTVWGESFLTKTRGRAGGPPQELYWHRALDMTPQLANGRQVVSWTLRPDSGAESQVFAPRDVIQFKTVNLVNPIRGLSPLSSIGSEIATGRLWAQRLAAMIANDSIPPVYWQVPKDAEFTKQDENLVRRTLRALRGPRNKGRSAIMPTGIEAKTIALTPQAAEMVAQRKISRMAVCAVTGVPLPLAGDDEKGGVYANLRDAERVFWRATMVPVLDRFADTLNNWLVPDFDPTRRRLVIAFDYSEIEALKPTLDVEWNMWLAGIYSQAVVPNEFRRHFRLGADVPWGDKPIPRTAVAIKAQDLSPDQLPGADPADVATLQSADTITGEIPDALRAYGRDLYKHPAVRAWVVRPDEPLPAHELFGGRYVDTPTRMRIEAGLRRRDTAATIAAALEVPV